MDGRRVDVEPHPIRVPQRATQHPYTQPDDPEQRRSGRGRVVDAQKAHRAAQALDMVHGGPAAGPPGLVAAPWRYARVSGAWGNICSSQSSILRVTDCYQRCAGVPTTIIIEVLSGLPLLRHLRLKGVPSPAIPLIATYLPQLESLDTDYVQSYSTRKEKLDHPIPNIRQLTIHTSSIDEMGLDRLWRWILDLVPKAGLETFKLDAYTVSGEAAIPRRFILDLAQVHGRTLRHFEVGEAGMTMTDIECLCTKFAEIESIGCSVLSTDIVSLCCCFVGLP